MTNSTPGEDQPFFLWLAYQTPHTPLQVPQEFEDLYPGEEDPSRKTTLGMISAMDAAVGELIETLKESGRYENTLIVFTSDVRKSLI